jgi:hypothetical protein
VASAHDDGRGDAAGETIWDGVDRLIDASPGLADLQAHGLHLLAARRFRSLGRPIPPDLARAELWAAFRMNAARTLLEKIRPACEGPIVLVKGPAIAVRYPDAALRPFLDLDLLVADADAAQKALLAAGFEPGAGRLHPDTTHHLRPLHLSDLPLSIELHRYPKWIDGLQPPSLEDLLTGSEPAATGIDGILTLVPSYHAVVLAAHLWAHDPLARLLRVVDVAVMAEAAEQRELESLIDAWGITKPWEATMAVADALLLGTRRQPLALRLWARNLSTAREATVFEMHLARCLAPFSVLPAHRALKALCAELGGCLRPQPDESWRGKLERTTQQLRRPSMRRSEHARGVEANLMEPEPSTGVRARRAVRLHVSRAGPVNGAVMRWSLAWLLASSLWGTLAALTVVFRANPAYRAPIVLAFVLVCPGLALVRVLGIRALTAQLSLGVALSLALDVLVPAGLLYAGVWSPSAALLILVGLTVAVAAFDVLARTLRISFGLR